MLMNYFFGIGIDKYLNVNALNNAVKDVHDIVQLLVARYDFEEENTLLLTDKRASRSNIIESLERYREKITPLDSLLIYYSGHGHITKDKRGFWMPVDAEKGKISSYIGNEIIQTYIKAIKSKHTLLISDSCFSGSLFLRYDEHSGIAMDELDSRQSRWVFSSGRDDEKVSDGIKGENSPFASALLKELRINTLAKLNVQKLGVRVVEITRNNYNQLPELCPLFDAGDEGGQFVFRLRIRDNQATGIEKVKEQKKPDDDLDWYLALTNNKIADYEKYILDFTNGKFTREAINEIIKLSKGVKADSSPKKSLPKARREREDLMFLFGKAGSGKSTIIEERQAAGLYQSLF